MELFHYAIGTDATGQGRDTKAVYSSEWVTVRYWPMMASTRAVRIPRENFTIRHKSTGENKRVANIVCLRDLAIPYETSPATSAPLAHTALRTYIRLPHKPIPRWKQTYWVTIYLAWSPLHSLSLTLTHNHHSLGLPTALPEGRLHSISGARFEPALLAIGDVISVNSDGQLLPRRLVSVYRLQTHRRMFRRVVFLLYSNGNSVNASLMGSY